MTKPFKIFTGQTVVVQHKTTYGIDDSVLCYKCKGQIGLRTFYSDDTGLAYLDPYQGKKGVGAYVHFSCLSKKRMAEIKKICEKVAS